MKRRGESITYAFDKSCWVIQLCIGKGKRVKVKQKEQQNE